jgi:hypothetical protein
LQLLWQSVPLVYTSFVMSNRLRSQIDELAASFASSIVETIRGASLQELIAEPHRAAATGGSSRVVSKLPTSRAVSAPSSSGRLTRRSPEDIAMVLDNVLSLVRKNKEGLRAEQIRAELGLQSKELPRILKEGLTKKKLKAKGQKRATTYYAA